MLNKMIDSIFSQKMIDGKNSRKPIFYFRPPNDELIKMIIKEANKNE